MCTSERACVYMCERACEHAYTRVCVRVHACVSARTGELIYQQATALHLQDLGEPTAADQKLGGVSGNS